MKLEKISKSGTTSERKSFWDLVSEAVIASQKVPGKNISVNVHEGYGSIVSVNPQRQGSGPPACPPSITIRFTGVSFSCGCISFPDFGASGTVSDSSFNDADISLTSTTVGETCDGCLWTNCAGGSWFCDGFPDDYEPKINIDHYGDSTDCTGDFTPETYSISIVVWKISGVYYVVALLLDTIFGIWNTIVFYGSSSDPSNIPNLSDCDSSPSNILPMCTGFDTSTLPTINTGGHASIT